jgi:hypothetical protein
MDMQAAGSLNAQGLNNANVINVEEIKSDLADHEDAGGSKGVTNELTKEDEEGLAKFLKNVQGHQLKNDMTLQIPSANAGDNLVVNKMNLIDFDSKSAADPTDFQ